MTRRWPGESWRRSALEWLALASSLPPLERQGDGWKRGWLHLGAADELFSIIERFADANCAETETFVAMIARAAPSLANIRDGLGLRKPMLGKRSFSIVSMSCYMDRARRSSFQTMGVSPLRA